MAATIYTLLLILVIFAEFSTKVNTDNLLEKTGLALIGIGSIISLSQTTLFMPIGVTLYLSSVCYGCYIRKRRKTDGEQ